MLCKMVADHNRDKWRLLTDTHIYEAFRHIVPSETKNWMDKEVEEKEVFFHVSGHVSTCVCVHVFPNLAHTWRHRSAAVCLCLQLCVFCVLHGPSSLWYAAEQVHLCQTEKGEVNVWSYSSSSSSCFIASLSLYDLADFVVRLPPKGHCSFVVSAAEKTENGVKLSF